MNESNEQPAAVWRHFRALCAIPRVSENEAQVRQYVISQARAHGARHACDSYGNIVLYLPGGVDAPAVAIQGHLDMVAATAPGTVHDWQLDPIVPRIEGDRMYATGTSLGADNGIGVSMALALLEEPNSQHGPIELVFTIEEEIGLRGAANLDASLIDARRLINIDSEEIEKLTIGCAGGATVVVRLPVTVEETSPSCCGLQVTVSGGLGGHSGIEINKGRANAIKLLAECLGYLAFSGTDFKVASIEGGSASNAIPNSASATLAIAQDSCNVARERIESFAQRVQQDLIEQEPQLKITEERCDLPTLVLADESAKTLFNLVGIERHGVHKWSDVYPGKVETSGNVALVSLDGEEVSLTVSFRSFLHESLNAAQSRFQAEAKLLGAVIAHSSGYPGWEPSSNSSLLRLTQEAYEKVYGIAPEIDVVHAGLECGAIIDRIPGLEAISFGPNIRDAHTAHESVEIPTVETTWRVLTALLERLAKR